MRRDDIIPAGGLESEVSCGGCLDRIATQSVGTWVPTPSVGTRMER
jgi:hypothetical protein